MDSPESLQNDTKESPEKLRRDSSEMVDEWPNDDSSVPLLDEVSFFICSDRNMLVRVLSDFVL